ncbi:kinase-like protein, partial [Fragilariopsis cylindrus CCMP1102]
LASALECVPSRNIIYRDLKPTNIGFTCDRTLNLFDFGLACELIPSKQKAAGIIGTIRYMTPEVCLGQEYDCDCDIYCYAIVCYELWTQCLPYETLIPELYQAYVCRRRRGYRPNQDQQK